MTSRPTVDRLRLALIISLLPAWAMAGERPAAPAAAPPVERMIAVTIDDLPVNGADPGLAALTAMNERLLAAVKRQGVPAVGVVNEAKL